MTISEILKQILKAIKKLISEVLYEVYQRDREDLFIDDEEELGNGAEEIKEYPEDPNDDYDED